MYTAIHPAPVPTCSPLRVHRNCGQPNHQPRNQEAVDGRLSGLGKQDLLRQHGHSFLVPQTNRPYSCVAAAYFFPPIAAHSAAVGISKLGRLSAPPTITIPTHRKDRDMNGTAPSQLCLCLRLVYCGASSAPDYKQRAQAPSPSNPGEYKPRLIAIVQPGRTRS